MPDDLIFAEVVLWVLGTAIGAPTILWFATKGKLSDLFMPRAELDGEIAQLLKDVNEVGSRVNSLILQHNTQKADLESVKDRCTLLESKQNPVAEGVERIEKKMDSFLDRTAKLETQTAIHTEQLKSLFNNSRRASSQ